MPFDFENVELWARSLGRSDRSKQVERLRTAFFVFRERTEKLLAKISTSFPNLTVHDISHIDALWETANLIVGPKYPINPMEGFVLGGAILLHDSALCFEAYEKGQTGLRETIQWKDAFAAEQLRNNERDTPLSNADLEDAADFSTARLLHADQAKLLIDRRWIDPDTNTEMFLIDDSELRKKYGLIMGEIAASHAWDIEEVSERLPNQINSPGDMPPDWRIDPVKIACILRCADATHIDNRRAPDFLHALTRREGLSFRHWRAQNWLSRADIDQTDASKETLIFTSNRDFEKSNSEEWWIAFDAISLANKEIQDSNALLSARAIESSPAFSVKRVAGVSSPDLMRAHIRTRGWEPYRAELHVSNVQKLVKNFGGAAVYGSEKREHFAIVLRELVQNARDAVVARRQIESDFKGRIRVRIFDDEGQKRTLEVSDNGVGMSQRTIANAILDFGSSFWRSDLIKKEFPGLQSSGFRPVGQYGIGFYSVFMVADEVSVSSRRYDRGLESVSTMEFTNGLSLRPTFAKGHPTDFPHSNSTRIRCVLKSNFIDDSKYFEIPNQDKPSAKVGIAEFLPRLVCGLDVDVEVDIDGSGPIIHSPPAEFLNNAPEMLKWLKKITLSEHRAPIADVLTEAVGRLRPIISNDKLSGLAAISSGHSQGGTGLSTIGGLLAGSLRGLGGGRSYVGYIDNYSASAKRDPERRVADAEALKKWALEQQELLRNVPLSVPQRLVIGHHFCDFDIDPTEFASVLIFGNNQYLVYSIDQTVQFMKSNQLAVFRMKHVAVVDVYVKQAQYQNFFTLRATDQGSFNSLEMVEQSPKHPNSLIGCIYRRAREQGFNVLCQVHKDAIDSVAGPSDALVFSLERISAS